MLILLLTAACKEDSLRDNINDDAAAPQRLSLDDVQVTPFAGGAMLKYALPDDARLLYIEAEYEIRPGVTQRTKASYYTDSIRVEGFGAAGDYVVNLYSVGRNEKKSAPLPVPVQALTPPVETVLADLQLVRTFGGVKIIVKNPSEAVLSIVLMADTLGVDDWITLDTYYTRAPEQVFTYKGLKPVDTGFSVHLRDQWGNKSVALLQNITPLQEIEIPKPYAAYALLSDVTFRSATENISGTADGDNGPMDHLWDNVWMPSWPYKGNSTTKETSLPLTFTIDLQRTVILSSFLMQHQSEHEYKTRSPRLFELYGSGKDTPDDNLFGGDWSLIGSFEFPRPPEGYLPPEPWLSGNYYVNYVPSPDVAYANIGVLFETMSDMDEQAALEPVRFVRFRVSETFNGPSPQGAVTIAELTFYGQIVE